MLGGWRTQQSPTPPPSRPRQEPYCWGLTSSVFPVGLVLWMTALALGCVAGSGPDSGPPVGATGAMEGLHHIHLNHGGKRHHSVPIALRRWPAALLRAGHNALWCGGHRQIRQDYMVYGVVWGGVVLTAGHLGAI
ncbi:hypothetical protein J4Q44_G00001450 [Coregonus suidteri]|uniref:Uncharacterized protein n=1 Tax=Coregonus suidteri TaxID=861788 RepID=A0AAN8MIT9_9TELE